MSIVDMHTHAFPNKIAQRASQAIGSFYGLPVLNEGSYSDLIEKGGQVGIGRFALLTVATNPDQTISINSALANALAAYPGKLIGFAGIHPDFSDKAAAVGHAMSLGAAGIKIHPDIQGFPADDPRMFPVYELMSGRLILFTHAGDYRYDHSSPLRIRNVRRAFPRLTIICAHFGGWNRWDEARALLSGEGLYVDTSSTTAWKTEGELVDLINAFGYENVLFGTDYPMWDMRGEVERIASLPVPAHVKDSIFHGNAERLLGEAL